MKGVLLAFSAFLANSLTDARPGGTLGYGGVIHKSKDFDPYRDLDYMSYAVNAGEIPIVY